MTVADASAGADGDYSHDIAHSLVQSYIKAAHRNKALLVLDIQPGRSSFATVAKRWGWALRDPWVGLALDPEWRMAPGQIPGRVIGHVSAAEVNRTSAWLHRLTARHHLPQKVFMLHQFRAEMVRNVGTVKPRTHLAMGFKLFYDEDTGLMSPKQVLAIRPRVRFISYQ